MYIQCCNCNSKDPCSIEIMRLTLSY